MPEPISLSPIAAKVLGGLSTRLLGGMIKSAGSAVKDLFSRDPAQSILNNAFCRFKESANAGEQSIKEDILLRAFEEFFSDDRIHGHFQQIFQAQSRKIDFTLLNEIFAGICDAGDIYIPDFNFFQALSQVIREVETLAQQEEEFRSMFHLSHLENIYSQLQERGQEPNFTFSRFKYLRQLVTHNKRLQFTGIPDLRDKKDIELPMVFVMQRAVENVPEQDYHRPRCEPTDNTGQRELRYRLQICSPYALGLGELRNNVR